MAIAIAQIIGLGASEIDRQFQLEAAGRRIIEIDQRKFGKFDPIDNLQTEGAPIKIERSRLVNDADHRVDELGHKSNSQLEIGRASCRERVSVWGCERT